MNQKQQNGEESQVLKVICAGMCLKVLGVMSRKYFLLFVRRFAALSLCCLLYSSLWASYLYFNAEVADSTGEPVKLRDAVVHFFTSPLWMDLKVILKQSLYNLWNQGLHETWKQLMTELDPHGEHQALKVLYSYIYCHKYAKHYVDI